MSNREISRADSGDISPNILIERRDAIAIITINRAPQRNTLSIATIKDLIEAFTTLSQAAEITIIILHGLGEAFAAGADIKELLALNPISAVDFSRLGGRLFDAMRFSQKLIIAAIDGFCMGGGLDLALACDLCYAAPAAIFAHPGANIGIITGFGGTQRLPRAIGRVNAEQLFATAERINGRRAFEMGLVQALAEETSAIAFAIERATSMAKQGGDFIALIKTITRLAREKNCPRAPLLIERYRELIRHFPLKNGNDNSI
jgi:enoyl-CoA hydratase